MADKTLFEELLPADLFLAAAPFTGVVELFLKLDSPIEHLNAVGAHDGKFYTFKPDHEVELHCHSWEWAVGYQATENCLECGRPQEKVVA